MIISNNKLDVCNNTETLFNALTNLKFLNLSSNFIEVIRKNTFSNLLKLRIIDLSNNKIYSVLHSSFNGLINLRELFLNQNKKYMKIENSSFVKFETIKTIYVDRSILNDDVHKLIFINMVKWKNIRSNKKVLDRTYFHAFNLIVPNEMVYDCELVFEFLRFDVQYNLRTDSDYDSYLANCQSKKLKRKNETV